MFERNGCITHQTFNWVFAVLLLLGMRGDVHAHEGHAALPTKGATVVGDQLLLSAGARKAIGLKTRHFFNADHLNSVGAKIFTDAAIAACFDDGTDDSSHEPTL